MWYYHHFVQGGTGKNVKTYSNKVNVCKSNLANSDNSRVMSGPPHDEGVGNNSTALCCG